MMARRQSDLALYARLLREVRPHWPRIGALLLLGMLSTPIALLVPLPLKIAIDNIIGSEPLPRWLTRLGASLQSSEAKLALATGLILVIAVLDHLQRLGLSVLGTWTGECLALDFRAKLFRHVQRLSLAYHDRIGTADSTYRIHWDAAAIQWVAIQGITPFLSAALTIAGMLYITARLDWELALAALGVTPTVLLVTSIARRRLRSDWLTTKTLESHAYSVLQEALTAVRVVKAFGQESHEQARYVTRSIESMRARTRVALVESGFDLLTGLTMAAGTAVVLFLGVRHVQARLLSLGELVLVMVYLARLYAPLHEISKSINLLQGSLASAERAFALMDEPPDVAEKPDARRVSRASGAIAFRNVSFAYDGGDFALRDVSFDIPPGTRIGISGATGAGKTTLVSLLMRFYDPTEGHIFLDGIDLRDYRLSELRNQFSLVLQDSILFSTSIYENIAYARPDATEDEIVAAAKAANAHEFIISLPDGYRTSVGERGMRLSGGERQRVALARAFLKDAPILILDEPTSAVDFKTETAIMDAMVRLMQNRTTFVITHRLSMLALCDTRLEMANGHIVVLAGPRAEGEPIGTMVHSP